MLKSGYEETDAASDRLGAFAHSAIFALRFRYARRAVRIISYLFVYSLFVYAFVNISHLLKLCLFVALISYPLSDVSPLILHLLLLRTCFFSLTSSSYAVVLRTFYDVAANNVGYYLIFFCLGNYLGPITLGRMFDAVGRVRMISTTYMVSGVLLAVTAVLFLAEALEAITQVM